MPYKDKNDSSLPDAVKELDDDMRQLWVSTFNGVMENDDDEGKAAATAWDAVNKAKGKDKDEEEKKEQSKLRPVLRILQAAIEGINHLLMPKKRAVDIPTIYWAIDSKVYELGYWLVDLYADSNDSIFAVAVKDGKLFRINVSIDDNGVVTIPSSELWTQVQIDFTEVSNQRSTTHIFRTNDDEKYRWITVSAVAVLNKAGEIDSTELFENMTDRFMNRADDAKPIYRKFYHTGESLLLGEVEWIASHDTLLITAGTYYNNDLAMREIELRRSEPDLLGDSIEFSAYANEIIDVDGIQIRVFTDGEFDGVATVFNSDACNFFTALSSVLEVKRMELTEIEIDRLKKFVGDEDKANAILADLDQQRQITKSDGAIYRSVVDDEPEVPPADEPEVPAADEPEVPADDEPEVPPVDDVSREIIAAIEALNNNIVAVNEKLDTELQAIRDRITGIEDKKRKARKILDDDTPYELPDIHQIVRGKNSIDDDLNPWNGEVDVDSVLSNIDHRVPK